MSLIIFQREGVIDSAWSGRGPEVERRAVTCEVAGIGERMHACPAEQRQWVLEGVDGDRRVHMQVAEQDLVVIAGWCHGLVGGGARRDDFSGDNLAFDLARVVFVA